MKSIYYQPTTEVIDVVCLQTMMAVSGEPIRGSRSADEVPVGWNPSQGR